MKINMPLAKEEKQKIIKKFAQAKEDTGSPEIQVALLNAEIGNLQEHIEDHGHDRPAKRALLTKVAKRRRLLRYLASHNADRYTKLIGVLGMKK